MSNPYKVVKDFEETISKFTGSKHAVAVDSCTNALFLCAKYLKIDATILPARTYPSVPCAVINAGGKVSFMENDWVKDGYYRLIPYPIYDAAHVFYENMYSDINLPLCGGDGELYPHAFICLSFSATKPINIGKGGMILTNDDAAVTWFKQARHSGRHELPLMEDSFDIVGWNMYMLPEQAARGLQIFYAGVRPRSAVFPEYPDLSQYKIYQSQ